MTPAAGEAPAAGGAAGPARARARRWGFGSAGLMVLALMLVGQGVCLVGEPYFLAAKDAWIHGDAGRFASGAASVGWTRSLLFAGFLVSAAAWTWLQRAAVLGFFRSMHAGVALVSLTTVAVATGVLVPQIDGFEDAARRVTPASYAEDYKAFRWAEAYFLYHLTHLYGVGMPSRELPPQAALGLERFGWKYGLEERDNRRKQMQQAFDSMAKQEELDAFVERHDAWLRKAFDVCTALHLNRTFKSYWFASLLTLLGTAVALNLRGPLRSLFSLQRLGFAVVHSGMLILLAGGWVSKACTDRGILHLDLTEPPRNTYWRHFDPQKLARMPFWVRLDRFARQEWKKLEVRFLDERFQSQPPSFTLWDGRTIDLDYERGPDGAMRPSLELRVLGLAQRAEVALADVREGTPDDGQGEAAFVALRVPSGAASGGADSTGPEADSDAHLPPLLAAAPDGTRRIYLTPELEFLRSYSDPGGRFRLCVARAGEAAPLFPAPGARIGTLDVQLATRPDAEPMHLDFSEADIGRRLAVADGYEIELVRATQNFRLEKPGGPELVDARPLAEQPQRLGAVEVRVHAPGKAEVETRILIEGIDPVEFDLTGRYVHKELVARLSWDRWSAPGPPRYALVLDPRAEPVLRAQDAPGAPGGGEAAARSIRVGERLELPGQTAVIAERFFARARFDTRVDFLPARVRPDGWDEDFYAREPRGLELEVVRWPGSERERRQTVRMSTSDDGKSNVWITPERDVALVFYEDTRGFPFEWRSVLSMVEKDGQGQPYTVPLGTEREREIRVNDYFRYRGYRFFQTNAEASLPTYSGIGVVYDPGIEIVLAGMYTIIAGSVIAFLVRPIVRARRRQVFAP